MKITVFGTGAVGGHIAGRLAAVDADVSVLARGATLAAVRDRGLQVHTRDAVLASHPFATDDPGELGTPDVVVVAVKAPSLPGIAEPLAELLGPDSIAVLVGNGIPWWYFHDEGGPLDGTRLPRLDPGDRLWTVVGPHRVAGGVAYTACTVVEPGVVRAENPRNRLIIGRPDGAADERLDALAALLTPSGLETSVTPRIRDAIWAKLSMNLVGGSLSVLTASPMSAVLNVPAVLQQARVMAQEGAEVARSLGCQPGDPTGGLETLSRSTHLQSIGQDLLAGRPMEIDALLRVPLDLARLVNVPTPHLDLVVSLAEQRARAAGLYEAV